MQQRRPREASETARSGEVRQALRQLEKFADVLQPEDAEEPILAKPVRAAVHEWLTEIRYEQDLVAVNMKPRRMALLYGPPGTGKTTLAWHLAARLGLPLVAIKSESIVDCFLGSTGKNLGALFDLLEQLQADETPQAVVFFDEVDAIASKRMHDQGASVERAASLTVMLRRVEKFKGLALAATNRKEALDSAMWRRFGLHISVDLPSDEERFFIIKRYAAPFEMPDADIDVLVDLTAGASPSLLRQIMEGMKRALVIGPRIGQVPKTALEAFERIISSVAPPPEMETPPLWAGKRDLKALSKLAWPPVIKRSS